MLLSGVVSAANLRYMWLIHLIALVPLLLMLILLPEPKKIEHHNEGKIKLPAAVFGISASLGFIYMILNPLLLNMSTILIQDQFGDAAVAGTILSMYTVGGILAGISFFIIFPAVVMEVGHRVSRAASAMASAIVLSAINLGGFLSSFYIGILSNATGNTSARLPIFAGMVMALGIGVVWGLVVRGDKTVK